MVDDADSSRGSAEHARLNTDPAPWRRWGPYLAERQWGTVREDYSPGGTAWKYLPHDHARSRAYRWGEDGIAGFSDDRQHLCLSLALWNGKDPILKERMFGLDNEEGNHGEDVKELWYFSDAVPSHAYLKMLYKYPQREYPYRWLVEENARRGEDAREFELLDTGIFDDDRYFDVEVEYAKAGPDDILMLVTAHNRGPDTAELVLLPTLTCRNIWSWKAESPRPRLSADHGGIAVEHPCLGAYRCDIAGSPELLFCDNDTNVRRLFGVNAKGFFKDAFHERVVHGDGGAVNPERVGTKAAALHRLTIPAGGSATVRLRLRPAAGGMPDAWADFDAVVAQRRREADAFYAQVQVGVDDADQRLVQRQAYAGMIWSKQLFLYDVDTWLSGDPLQPPPPPGRAHGRNRDWRHVEAADIISMPDTWEYPWFASWDLAFHCVAFADIDHDFAKAQMLLLLGERYINRNGQLPAYEWAFGDANPPVHAWAAWRVFQIDRRQRRAAHADDAGDQVFLRRVIQKLLLNFSWWVNRKDAHGRNIYQGGFLGLDNIGCFDRGKPLPTGGYIDQADGTSWMAMYSLNLLRIAIELALHDHVYEELATTFFDHFLAIAQAINGKGEGGDGTGLWDEGDGFYYDRLHLPDGSSVPLRIQSIVGLIPLLAVEVLEPDVLQRLPGFAARLDHHLKQHPELADLISNWTIGAAGDRRLLSLLRGHRMKALLRRMLDSTQFLSDHGVRSLSKVHEAHPFRLEHGGQIFEVPYWPAESRSRLFGGNSNWRGPVWMPLNYLLIEALQKFHHYYGDDFRIECPTGSGKFVTILEVAQEISNRLVGLFTKGGDGQRPVLKMHPKLSGDPRFRDHVLFHEYFDGDTGRGVGAAHQTGWTALVARLVRRRRPMSDQHPHHLPQQGTKP
jgi:hypothetical protein